MLISPKHQDQNLEFCKFKGTLLLDSYKIHRFVYQCNLCNDKFTSAGWRKRLLIGLAWLFAFLFSLPMLFLADVQTGTTQCRISLPSRIYWQVGVRLSIRRSKNKDKGKERLIPRYFRRQPRDRNARVWHLLYYLPPTRLSRRK